MKTIPLSENVQQDEPVGWLVFAHKSFEHDYVICPDRHEAQRYAVLQAEKAGAPEDSWPIYALWASEWPLDHTPDARKKAERIVRRETDPARQACIEGMLERNEAWLCECGQINGHHNSRCCHCDKSNDTLCPE